MKKILTLLILVVGIIALFFLLSKKEPSQEKNQLPPVATQTTDVSEPKNTNQTVNIDIKNFSFNPTSVTIKKGTKVVWTNHDSAPHTVTSDSGNTLNSSNLSMGQSYSFTFDTAGSFNYHCAVHPMMMASIIVTE